ncbi:Cna B-type domain-containing protein [Enterococcus sp. MMGLQ5-2]|uniref:Cna B-type domain-containing protein n=1 Tax=Enterococcus sp. MMGLQ5-2 TaxID=2737664 RepID=UPI001553F4CF|nr:Cna B-type domain-containing protein [Enterococcus sp. MMGLQ5-2]MBS7576981.1 Cna B-type domain-containing protein [Enterococcus sp. MMGLQ5-2]MBS7584572.1 Cna B-type domain-containing protein [Enterococcus sp. MMGLQ5-1]NPD12427.1 Cna B-type domain-containing protein [Enterococcus sp. MMGLQ5-1]NPD36815.1 Cna B-type domain-containing protein [Enterococcus sp. MMGLQ5-2]
MITYHGTINGKTESYPHAIVGGVLGGIDYEGNGHYPNWGNPTGSWFDFNRFGSWNTKEDGSGTYFRGGQVLNEEDVRIIQENGGNLYQQWANMLSFLNFSINPKVYLNGSSEHVNENTAFITDKGEYLNYNATLDYESIRKELSVLWGRIDKIESSSGYLNMYFDGRLQFDQDVEVFFASNWLKPTSFDNAREDVVEGVSGHTFTFNTSNLEKTTVKNIQGENVDAWTAKIPVSMADKSVIGTMSFDKFMEPMVLTVKDNYANGVASLVSETSFNDIALSENPFIETGGSISLTISGSIYGSGSQQRTLTGNATPQIAKIYPTGHYEIEYRNIDDNSEVNAVTYPQTTEYGRYKHSKLSEADVNNKSENYNIEIPGSIIDSSNNEQYFVKYTVNTDDSSATGFTESEISSVFTDTPIKYIAWYSKQNLNETYSVSGIKTWKDNDDQAGKRPDSITVNLLADGIKVASETVTAATDWKYDFIDLPKYKDGKEVIYTVTEDEVANYKSTIDGFNITNTYTSDVPTSSTNPSKADTNSTSEKQLPQTGEKRAVELSGLGLIVLLFLGGYFYSKKNKFI